MRWRSSASFATGACGAAVEGVRSARLRNDRQLVVGRQQPGSHVVARSASGKDDCSGRNRMWTRRLHATVVCTRHSPSSCGRLDRKYANETAPGNPAVPNDDGLGRPADPMERAATAADVAVVRVAAAVEHAAMLVATVVSMWALSAMAVTVRHGRSRMARWAQQQHNDQQPPPPVTPSPPRSTVAAMVTAITPSGRLHDPGGGLSRTSPSRLQRHHRDKANVLLRIVESQQQLGGNCTAGTDLNMGEGVVDRYAQVRVLFFRFWIFLKTNVYVTIPTKWIKPFLRFNYKRVTVKRTSACKFCKFWICIIFGSFYRHFRENEKRKMENVIYWTPILYYKSKLFHNTIFDCERRHECISFKMVVFFCTQKFVFRYKKNYHRSSDLIFTCLPISWNFAKVLVLFIEFLSRFFNMTEKNYTDNLYK